MKKTFYFNDKDVIMKLQEVPNMSRYISDLIKADISNAYLTKEEVIELIELHSLKSTYNQEDTSGANKEVSDIAADIFAIMNM